MICGVLHDLIEDTDWTFERLEEEQFPQPVIEALQLVTRRKNENYKDFIERIAQNDLAVAVKLNDLEDNMDVKRLNTMTERDAKRLSKYIDAYRYLKSYNRNS